MRSVKRLTAALLLILMLPCLIPAACAEDSPRDEAMLQELLDSLSYDAWCTDPYMALPNPEHMLDQPETSYVLAPNHRGAKYYDGPDGVLLGRICRGSAATVYARYGEDWAFIQLSDKTTCWVNCDSLSVSSSPPVYNDHASWYIHYAILRGLY